MLTTWPPSRMCGRQSRVIRTSPVTVVPKTAASSSSLEPPARVVAVGARLDEDVRGERGKAARHRPDVQVVDADDVGLRGELRGYLVRIDLGRRSLEEDPPRVAEQRCARPEHQRGDGEARERVEAVPAGEQDQPAGERRPGERGEVGREMEKGAADVQALAPGPWADERRDEVHRESGEGVRES